MNTSTSLSTSQKGHSLILLIVILFLLIIGGVLYFKPWNIVSPSHQQIACTQEAKICPDGSSVGRTGPNCEFSACPENPLPTASLDQTTDWKTYTSDDKSFSFKYPKDWIYETKRTTLEFEGKQYDASIISIGLPLTKEQVDYDKSVYLNINDIPKTDNSFTLIYSTDPFFSSLTTQNFVENFTKTTAQPDSQKEVVLTDKLSGVEVEYGCQADCIDLLFKHKNTFFDATTGPTASTNIDKLHQILSTVKFADQNTECVARPACLDTNPRCMMPEPADGWCK